MADDAGIEQQAFDIGLVHGGDLGNVEAMKDLAEVFALAQDGDPGEAGLEAFEADLFEQARVGGDGAAPFVIVIMAIKRVLARPGAARQAVIGIDHNRHAQPRFTSGG